MFKKVNVIFLIAETPLHPGSGSELGIVDLPIQRERHTNFPKIEGSSIKGCIREAFETRDKIEFNGKELKDKPREKVIELVFGPEEGETHAGALTFTDAKILLFPVKSLKGIFAWITCPIVLERFKRDMEIAEIQLENDFEHIKPNTVPQSSDILHKNNVVLEEYAIQVNKDPNTENIAKFLAKIIFPNDPQYIYWKQKLEKDLVILSDEDFESFVTTSTEIIARTKIDVKTGTVAPGALWHEEYLPQDTILYTLAMATPLRSDEKSDERGIFAAENPEKEAEKVIEFLKAGLPDVFQIGGNQTIGKGFVRAKIYEKGGDKNE